MAQEYKIISENVNSGGGITETEVTYVSTTAATVTFSALTATFYGNGSNLTNINATWDGLQVITVGEDVVAGDLLFLSGDSKYYKASNTSEIYSSTELRLAVSATTANNTVAGLVQGKFTTNGLTAGEQYWVGSSNGSYTNTQPTGDGNIVRYIGTAISSTELEFNPDALYIEISSSSGPSTQPGYREVTTSGNILITDFTVDVSTTGNTTQTLPLSTSLNKGKVWNVKNSDYTETSLVTVSTTSGQLIDRDPLITSVTLSFPQSLTFQSTGNGYIII